MNLNEETLSPIAIEPEAPQDKPLDLVSQVCDMLKRNGANATSWLGWLHPEAINTGDLNIQRFHINRAWVSVFATLTNDDDILKSRNARGCLMNGKCSLEDWIRLFETKVIPSALELGVVAPA